ncbi:MAG: hypothetical protein H6712_22165 [Myxococcales bacterium]|nr:hypothetical protein [Myxococcales bacterium]
MPQGIALGLLSTWLLAWSPASRGEPEAETEPPGVVLMAPDLPEVDDDERLIARVRSAAQEGEASLHVVRYDPEAFDPATLVELSRRRAGEHVAAAVLWLDLRGPGSYALYLFEVEGERVLGRRVPIEDGATAAAHEALANIATSVVAESIEGPVTGLTQLDPTTLEEAPDPEPEPAAEPEPETEPEPKTEPKPKPLELVDAPPPPAFPRLWLSLAYAGSSFSRDPLLSHGLALGAAWSPAPRAFVGLRYDLVLPLTLDDPQVRLSLRRHPISLEGGYRFGLARRWDLEVAGRLSVDPIRRITDDRSALAPTADAWRLFSSGALAVGVGVAPIRELRVGLRVGAEGLLSRADYVANDPESRLLLSPHPVRGFVELGLAFATLWRPKKN